MALLQIAEPGQSTAPHQHRFAAGIDLEVMPLHRLFEFRFDRFCFTLQLS